MKPAIVAAFVVAVVILPGFGGAGPIHSGRCRGEAVTVAATGTTIARCTRAGWRYYSPTMGPIGRR